MSRWPALLASLSLAAACTAGPVAGEGGAGSGQDGPTTGAGAVAGEGSSETSGGSAAHNDTSTPFNLFSLPALIDHRYDGRGLRVGPAADAGATWTEHRVSYRSGDLTITGQLTVPKRRGRHPVVVVAHGYQDPATYRSDEELVAERRLLATRGYVVLMPDYRNYGGSDHDSAEPVAHPLGYPADVVNAIRALRLARLPYVDAARLAVLGRSMGGGVAQAAVEARPGFVDALVLYSSVSSRAADNYAHWVEGNSPLDEKVLATYGAPQDNPRFWREASPRAYVDRVDLPVQVHHGTSDPVCPPRWSRATVAALRGAGVDVRLYEYPGETHRIDRGWPLMMRRVVRFLKANV